MSQSGLMFQIILEVLEDNDAADELACLVAVPRFGTLLRNNMETDNISFGRICQASATHILLLLQGVRLLPITLSNWFCYDYEMTR